MSPTPSPSPTKRRAFHMRLPVFLVVVAGCSLILWAWKFNRANRNIPRATMTLELEKLAQGVDSKTRKEAAASLQETPPELVPEAIEPLLVAATRDNDPTVRIAAIIAVDSLIGRADPSSEEGMVAQADRALPVLASILDDSDTAVRIETTRAICQVVTKVGRTQAGLVNREMTLATTALLKALRDPEKLVRAEAARAFGALRFDLKGMGGMTVPISPDPRQVLPVLEELALNDPSPLVRAATVNPIMWLRPNPDEAPTIVPLMLRKERNRAVSHELVQALGNRGWNPNTGPRGGSNVWSNGSPFWLPMLDNIQHNSHIDTYLYSQTFSSLGPPPSEAVPALIETLTQDSATELREAIANALKNAPAGSFDPDDPAVQQALSKLVPTVRTEIPRFIDTALAIAILDPGGLQAREVRPLLSRQLQAPEVHEDYFSCLASAIAEFGPDAADQVPELISLFRQTTKRTRRDAIANVFLHIGSAACDAITLLAEHARGPIPPAGEHGLFYAKGTKGLDALPSHIAAHALFAIDPDAPETRSLLIPMALDAKGAQHFQSSRKTAYDRTRQEFAQDALDWVLTLIAHDPAVLRKIEQAAVNEIDLKRRSGLRETYAFLQMLHELTSSSPATTGSLP